MIAFASSLDGFLGLSTLGEAKERVNKERANSNP
jgi:hypothetical protein